MKLDWRKIKHTRVPNELMEILMSEALNNNEKRILLFIARQTYGYHKKSDSISNSQFAKRLNISKKTVIATLSRLTLVGITTLVKKGNVKGACNEWLINTTNYADKLVGITNLVKYDVNKLVGITTHTKESIQKESSGTAFSSNQKFWDTHITAVLSSIEDKFSPDLIEQARAEFIEKARKPTRAGIVGFLKGKAKYLPPVLKPAKDATDRELLSHLKGKTPGRDEGIDEGYLYEALERGIYEQL